MTRPDHRTGTDRIAEVATHIPADIYINVQGDEPLIDPGTVDAVAAAMAEDDSIQLATPCAAITLPGEIMDPNVVKVVQDFDGQALYFSRAPIPWVRDTGDRVAAKHWKHIGLYGYRRDALLEFPTLASRGTGAHRTTGAVALAGERFSHARGGNWVQRRERGRPGGR